MNNLSSKIRIIRSNRKSIAIEISPAAELIIRAPHKMSDRQIQEFVVKHAGWIEKNLEKVRKAQQNIPSQESLTTDNIKELAEAAKKILPGRVAYFANQIGVTYGRITIRNQRTRWGSCSSKGNLNFNCLLMLTPPEIRDYVIVHELCHRKQMNHSAAFWAEVGRILPDYQERRKWLREHEAEIIRRMNR